MLDIKECRKIKRDYTKNYEGKKIVINVEGYPLCYMIVTHGDGKSWGYFFNDQEHIFLGRSNQIVYHANLCIKQYNVLEDKYDVELIGGNDAVKDVYKRLIDHFNKQYAWCINHHCSKDLISVFKINPRLFANLVDCGVLEGTGYYTSQFDYLDRLFRYRNDFDYTKPLIKDACGLSPKWIRFLLRRYSDVRYIKLLKKYNYSPDELYKDQYYWASTSIPEELIPNVEAGMKYAEDSLYRDYYNMRRNLSDENIHNFPVFPKNVRKYHDLIVPIYNRERIYRREKEISDLQEKYVAEVYDKAIKYNYADENYSIKACEKLIELLIEGTTLHHCVGSYINSVSEGREYILFLRKVSEPDTPYFTVDVTPGGHVRQIHGLHNCNINDDIRPFVNAWAKKFKLNITGCSGVYCAL